MVFPPSETLLKSLYGVVKLCFALQCRVKLFLDLGTLPPIKRRIWSLLYITLHYSTLLYITLNYYTLVYITLNKRPVLYITIHTSTLLHTYITLHCSHHGLDSGLRSTVQCSIMLYPECYRRVIQLIFRARALLDN